MWQNYKKKCDDSKGDNSRNQNVTELKTPKSDQTQKLKM